MLEDATDEAGVRVGHWGWGSCFADFNLDGHLDLFHVNGFPHKWAFEFHTDASVLYLNDGDGTFTERALELGIEDRGQGRGVVCFDYDGDGAIDILVANNRGPLRLYRNNGAGVGHHLVVTLAGPSPNTQGIGARVRVTIGEQTQMREIRAGSNYVSQDPAVAHFGLGAATVVDLLSVTWPDGEVTEQVGVAADQRLTVAYSDR